MIQPKPASNFLFRHALASASSSTSRARPRSSNSDTESEPSPQTNFFSASRLEAFDSRNVCASDSNCSIVVSAMETPVSAARPGRHGTVGA